MESVSFELIGPIEEQSSLIRVKVKYEYSFSKIFSNFLCRYFNDPSLKEEEIHIQNYLDHSRGFFKL